MDESLVSVLVNVYNAERYIGEALDSALAQTYQNIEVVVLDDHSADRTAEIVHGYAAKDARVRYIKPVKRLGLVEGRNELLRQMQGVYFTYLDADDIYLPDKIKEEIEFLEAHVGVAVVYCDIGYFFDGVPEAIYRHRYHFYSGDEVFPQLLGKMFITNTATMFRRGVYETFGDYRTDLGIVEDWEYFLRIALGGTHIAFLGRDLVRYRLRWDSHTNFKKQVQIQDSAVKIFEDLKVRMDESDRERYHIDFWIAKRKETYAIALVANGQGKAARAILRGTSSYISLIKKIIIFSASIFPASFVGFLIEQAWRLKRKNLFVPADRA